MRSSTMRRGLTVISSLAVCALSACGGENGAPKKIARADPSQRLSLLGSAPKAEGEAAPTEGMIDVTFQLTGLMLVVPPADSSGQTHVILPKVTQGITHDVRLAFGSRPSQVCDHYDTGREICFVNLDTWSLGDVGAGGAPAEMKDIVFPRGVVNVSRGSGGEHKVKLSEVGNAVRARLNFLSGQPDPNACRLAKWRFAPVGQREDTISLVNRLDWRIRHPADETFTLRFTRIGSGDTVAVPLLPVLGQIRILLAHVPREEMNAIITQTPMREITLPGQLAHFHDYYKLLRKQSGNTEPGESQRPLPRQPQRLQEECRVTITSGTEEKGAPRVFRMRGVKTYACVVGTGDT